MPTKGLVFHRPPIAGPAFEQASLATLQEQLWPNAPGLEAMRAVVRFRNLEDEQLEEDINVREQGEVSETRKDGKLVGEEHGERRFG